MSDASGQFDVLVVGGGPAGMAAACCAADSGCRVAVVDDNPGLGGQIWRGEESKPGTHEPVRWYQRMQRTSVEAIRGARVFQQPAPGVLLAETWSGLRELRYQKLVLATGARERFLPFPGWTLPNVMGAGGLQAMVKNGLSIAGKKVVVAGSGPLLLAVAAYLRQHGADVRMIAEQAPWSRLMSFATTLLSHPAKALQAMQLRFGLAGVPYRAGCWPVSAQGDGKLQRVTLRAGQGTWQVECDYLACGFHLAPNVELAVLLGCELQDGYVRVDEMQQTSVAGVYCAGEPTGIGGLELSLVEGEIAGYAAAGQEAKAHARFGERARWTRFARRLEQTFALREELKSLPLAETVVCRCEDVPLGRMREHHSWRAAKLQTRCGMGPCQGRICGSAIEFLLGWKADSVRPPIFPARLENLAAGAKVAAPITH